MKALEESSWGKHPGTLQLSRSCEAVKRPAEIFIWTHTLALCLPLPPCLCGPDLLAEPEEQGSFVDMRILLVQETLEADLAFPALSTSLKDRSARIFSSGLCVFMFVILSGNYLQR
ncbi:uncharacterized protein LOC144376351 isoform X2 [Ictidomys tridecemlineatus]